LAETLSLEVVAEGVELPAEEQLLIAAGCTLGQGFLFARPMPEVDTRQRIVDEAMARR
jgi:EAL domain-containing protein (putative c-di-GMP-specific phosphodiesterase class I)